MNKECIRYGYLLNTTVLTTSFHGTHLYGVPTYTAVRYSSITELAPLLDEDEGVNEIR